MNPSRALPALASVALGLSLGACTISTDGSGASSSSQAPGTTATTTAETATTTATQAADSAASAGSAGGSGTAGSAGTTGSAGSAVSGNAEEAPITDADWQNILRTGERRSVSGSYAVQDAGSTLNLVGDLDSLTVQGADATVAAEDVDTLVVQGSNVVVYARDINHLLIQGAGVTVHWLGDDPDIQDYGAGNTTGRLGQ